MGQRREGKKSHHHRHRTGHNQAKAANRLVGFWPFGEGDDGFGHGQRGSSGHQHDLKDDGPGGQRFGGPIESGQTERDQRLDEEHHNGRSRQRQMEQQQIPISQLGFCRFAGGAEFVL